MRLGYPYTADILESINKGRIINLPITRADLETVTKIWGRDLGSLVGKSTRKTPEGVLCGLKKQKQIRELCYALIFSTLED